MSKSLLIALIAAVQLSGTYHRETIDALWASTHDKVIIVGTIATLSLDEDQRLRFRVGDAHGHFVSCTLPNGAPQPRLGVTFTIYGTLKKYTVPERGQGVMEIRVEKLEPVE